MKKQIFILVFLVVATFASVSKSYGQATAGLAPRPLTITGTALTPIPGTPYTYSATINPFTGNAFWYATKSKTFITTGSRVASEIDEAAATPLVTGVTGYRTATATTASPTSTTVTWTGAAIAGVTATDPLFMVVEYNATGTGACATSNNIKVMKIVPQNAFTIDLTNMTHGGPVALTYGAAESQCYAAVASSSWNGTNMENDYGVNVLYFELIAANFTGSFKPTFQLSGLQSTQTADVAWDIAVGGTYANVVGTGIASPGSTTLPEQTVTTISTNTSLGVAIYVKVTVKNNGYEGLTNDAITLKVDAVDNSGNKDVIPAGTEKGAFSELAFQTLNLRPTVGAGTTQITQVP